MKTWIKVALVTVVLAVPAMMLGRVIWPPAEGGPEPTAGQLPFFLGVAAVEALAFGLGVAFLIFGYAPLMRSVVPEIRAWAIYLSVGWFLISWWPHGNLHIHNGMDMQGLLYIEYGFHVTLIVAVIALAYSLVTMVAPNKTTEEITSEEVVSAQTG